MNSRRARDTSVDEIDSVIGHGVVLPPKVKIEGSAFFPLPTGCISRYN